MSVDEYIENYDNHYIQNGKSGSGTGEYEIKLQLWYDAGYKDTMTVLDYGCGWGAMIPAIKNTSLYTGVDISKTAIDMGKEMFKGVRFEVMTPGKLNLKSTFDFVAAQSVFTHTPKDTTLSCLKDIKKHLKGFAIIDILHGEDNPSDWHVRHYSEDEWLHYIKQAGMKAEYLKNIQWAGGNHAYYKVS